MNIYFAQAPDHLIMSESESYSGDPGAQREKLNKKLIEAAVISLMNTQPMIAAMALWEASQYFYFWFLGVLQIGLFFVSGSICYTSYNKSLLGVLPET